MGGGLYGARHSGSFISLVVEIQGALSWEDEACPVGIENRHLFRWGPGAEGVSSPRRWSRFIGSPHLVIVKLAV